MLLLVTVSLNLLADIPFESVSMKRATTRHLDAKMQLIELIDLVTILKAILTSRQPCDKLHCLYENLMLTILYDINIWKKHRINNFIVILD